MLALQHRWFIIEKKKEKYISKAKKLGRYDYQSVS